MNYSICVNQLQEAIAKKWASAEFSTITREAWGNDKNECFEHLWGGNMMSWIKVARQIFDDAIKWAQVHGAADEIPPTWTPTTNNSNPYYEVEDPALVEQLNDSQTKDSWESTTTTTQQSTVQQTDTFGAIQNSFQDMKGSIVTVLWILALLYIGYILLKFSRYLSSFLYDIFNNNRLVYLKVILPRWDSKGDREKEKEIAKDMKEKISRMAQVYRNCHKLWALSVMENVMSWFFDKAKISLILRYEKGLLNFVIAVYPEYRNIIEWAIAAQYPEASIEETNPIKLYTKKFHDIIPMQPVKRNIYPIRIFKQLEDDPINNIVDSIGKISVEDEFTVLLITKPESTRFNVDAQKFADALYRKDVSVTEKVPLWKKILMPWKLFDFLIYGPSEGLIKKFSPWSNSGDAFVRMVKAEEEALNTMWEEAWKPAYQSWLLLISASNDQLRAQQNLQNVVSAYSIYKDEYNNELDQPEVAADLFGWILKPLWSFAATFHLTKFFYKKWVFTINELASLFHFPDWLFNRSPIIRWMDYKVLAAPDNIYKPKKENGYFMTWIIADEYKGWDLSKIFTGSQLDNIWIKKETEEKIIPYDEYTWADKDSLELVEREGQKYVKHIKLLWEKPWIKLYNDAVLLWLNTHRNRYTPIYMSRKDRSRHHYIIWKSGWGKSVYISALARQDVWNWDGLCVIDPHGDLVEDILQYIPKHRAKDIIYFDAWNEDRPMWLNLYEIDSQNQADRVVNDATEIFLKMFWPEIFGPRIQEYFKYGSLTLLADMEDGATLIDVPRLFTDEVYRAYKVKKVTSPYVRNFWERTYNAMWDREKQEIIPYFTSKFVSFTTNSLIRNIIWQTKSAFKFRQVMDEWKILLVNLSKWKIGELNAQLLWMILVSQIYNAAMSRADIPEDQRRDFFLYVDEFQNFVSWAFADILSEARKYHLALIMAHQYIGQLEPSQWQKSEWGKWNVKDAVFGNVGTMQSFKVGAPDAEFLEKEYAPVLSAQDIIWIANYKAYVKLNINNSTSRVFSMNTIWTQDYKNPQAADILKKYSSQRYARRREFVDAEIAARLGMMGDDSSESDSPAPVEATAAAQ